MRTITCLSCAGTAKMISAWGGGGSTHRTYRCTGCGEYFRTVAVSNKRRGSRESRPEPFTPRHGLKCDWPYPDRSWASLGLSPRAFA